MRVGYLSEGYQPGYGSRFVNQISILTRIGAVFDPPNTTHGSGRLVHQSPPLGNDHSGKAGQHLDIYCVNGVDI